MLRLRYLTALGVIAACVTAGAAWAASGGGTTTNTTPSKTTPSAPKTAHSDSNCPNMGSSSSGASYVSPANL